MSGSDPYDLTAITASAARSARQTGVLRIDPTTGKTVLVPVDSEFARLWRTVVPVPALRAAGSSQPKQLDSAAWPILGANAKAKAARVAAAKMRHDLSAKKVRQFRAAAAKSKSPADAQAAAEAHAAHQGHYHAPQATPAGTSTGFPCALSPHK